MLRIIQKKIAVKQRQTSRLWLSYRKEKAKILKSKRFTLFEKSAILEEKRGTIQTKVSEGWKDYREEKYGLLHHSPYSNFIFSKKIRTQHTVQKIYKAKRGYSTKDLDKVIPNILNEPDVTGILVVFSVESAETGQKQYVSNYISNELLKRIIESDKTIFEYVGERLRTGDTKDYNLKFIYLRIIYEKSKSIKR
jgi:hypothetical protein